MQSDEPFRQKTELELTCFLSRLLIFQRNLFHFVIIWWGCHRWNVNIFKIVNWKRKTCSLLPCIVFCLLWVCVYFFRRDGSPGIAGIEKVSDISWNASKGICRDGHMGVLVRQMSVVLFLESFCSIPFWSPATCGETKLDSVVIVRKHFRILNSLRWKDSWDVGGYAKHSRQLSPKRNFDNKVVSGL